jgi:hypothetical protein
MGENTPSRVERLDGPEDTGCRLVPALEVFGTAPSALTLVSARRR